jgi:hypothetical protein
LFLCFVKGVNIPEKFYSRPGAGSLQAYKDWIMAMVVRLMGKDKGDDGRAMSLVGAININAVN